MFLSFKLRFLTTLAYWLKIICIGKPKESIKGYFHLILKIVVQLHKHQSLSEHKFLLAQDFSLSKIALKLLTSVLTERPPRMPISVYYIKCLFLKKIRFIFEKRPFKLGSAILLSTESSWVMKTLVLISLLLFTFPDFSSCFLSMQFLLLRNV